MKKSIPVPVDVPGRNVSFRPTKSSHIMKGEVVKVFFKMGADPRYPKGSLGYKNGMRKLFKKMTVILPDGRLLNIPAEQDELRSISMVVDGSPEL